MIVVELDAETVGRIRFAPSPVAEAMSWLRLAVSGRRDPVYGDPGPEARWALKHSDVALVAQVIPPGGRGYVPDLLTPKPPPVEDVLDAQLQTVRDTGAAEVRVQVEEERFASGKLPAELRTSIEKESFAKRAANGVHLFWSATMKDRWPQLRSVLDTDLARRTRDVARGGIGDVVRSLHPDVDFSRSALRIRMPPFDESAQFVDTELVLSPGLIGWPHVSTQLCRPDDAVLRYPVARVENRARHSSSRSLAGLLGTTRSELLSGLDIALSTTELAERHRLSTATVSYHLGVLHECGLVVRSRDSHRVLYERSRRADLLWPR